MFKIYTYRKRNLSDYKKYFSRMTFSLSTKDPEIKNKSNSFGYVLWLLGVDNSPCPREVKPINMQEFLEDNCKEIEIKKEAIVAF